MNARLLPWAAMALLVLFLAIRSALPTNVVAVPPGAPGPETAGGGPEIRLGSVDVRELHDNGSWNRLDADEAVYAYASRTVSAGGVTVFLGEGAPFAGTTVRAPRAAWDLDGKTIGLPEGCRVARKDGWTGELSAATLNLAGSVLRVPGPARIEGPGVSVRGMNLAWEWVEGKITMESTTSRLSPAKGPGRKG
ncbi:MAG: hypothetical protein NUW14_06720 [Deltaproteobacteria bacterium]|uniref:hypothetical protein n=1 Tax=Candidatus Deferrimicrobium sp. TaxID=3060586 RepID=UPI00271FCA34|nr:hypothetical protein [Candidatus Deferrimicrobium sp.]MCR4309694.1 hypothetical protein [Deltaproteobacteria bacterium]MDO8739053.1 hypothetical protein [Candidatus Deferrimicrobium sp.]